jgi:hypothetical protein
VVVAVTTCVTVFVGPTVRVAETVATVVDEDTLTVVRIVLDAETVASVVVGL